MGSGERSQRMFQKSRCVPKGCLVVKVGQEEERVVVPLMYLNHPLFMQLLKEAEEEYGFHHKGTITIPCHLDQFRYVRSLIDRDLNSLHHNHHHSLLVACFRV